MKKLRIGIIGTGNIAGFHRDGYLAAGNCDIVALCDLKREKAEEFAKYCTGCNPTIYTDYNEMLKKEQLDAVSVTTWNSEHKNASVAALNAGVNVLCEKPMAMNAEEAKEMKEAADRNGKVLQIGFVRRFGPDCITAREYADSGKLGNLYFGKVSYLRRNGCPGGWFADKSYAGGGPLIDLGVHVMDFARYVAGCPKPVSVYGAVFSGIGHNRNDSKAWVAEDGDYKKDVEDFATAFVRFDNGFVLNVEASFNLNIKQDCGEIELFGTKAGLKLGTNECFWADGTDSEIKEGLSGMDFGQIFRDELKSFTECVADGKPCRAPAEDGVVLMQIIDAIYESARTGHEVTIG